MNALRVWIGLVFLFFAGSLGAVTLTNPIGSTFGTVDYVEGQYIVSIGYNAVNSSGNSEHQLWSVKPDGSRDVRFKFVALSRNGTYYGAAFSGTLAGADYPRGIIFVTRWGSGLPGAPFTESEVLVGGLQAQNISVTRDFGQPPAMIGVNETWSVSGAASGAPLQLGISEGANVIIYDGKVRITPTAEEYSFQVRAGATSTHSASAYATGSGFALPYSRLWRFDIPVNNNNVSIMWRVVQGSSVLASGEIPAGWSGSLTGTAPEPSPDPELQFASKFKYDLASERWVPVQSGEEQWTTVQIAELEDLPTSYSGSASLPGIGGQNSSGSGSTIWGSVNSSNENDLLTKGVYATGVSKLENSISSSAASMVHAGQALDAAAGKIDTAAGKMNEAATAIGAAAESFSGLGTKLDRVGDATEATRDNTREIADKLQEIRDEIPEGFLAKANQAKDLFSSDQAAQSALGAGQSAANAGRDSMQSALAQKFGSVPSAPDYSVGSAPSGVISIRISDTEAVQLPENPFSSSGPFDGVLSDFASIVKAFIAWGIVIAFYIWAIGEMNNATKSFFWVTPFSKSIEDSANSIKFAGIGGGWGYLLRMGALLILLPFILTMPLALAAVMTADLPIAQITAIIGGGPPSLSSTHSVIADAAAISDSIFPWAVVVGAPVWYVIVRFAILPSQFFWMVFAKFIPL